MKLLHLPLLALATLLAQNALAQDKPGDPRAQSDAGKAADYRYQMPLNAPGNGGLVTLRLPPDVYLHACGRQLQDLRLFDAQGNPVRFALHVPAAQEKSSAVSQQARIFPLHGSSAPNGNRMDLEVETRDGELAKVSLKSAGQKTSLQALLLDLGAVDKNMQFERLELQPPPDQANYSARLWLAVSDDLQNWETLGAADVRWLPNGQGEQLQQNQIRFAPRHFRYARLSFSDGAPVLFAQAHFKGQQLQAGAEVRDSLTLRPQPQLAMANTDLVYPLSRALPAERIGLEFTEANVVLPVTIGTYLDLPATRPNTQPGRRFEAGWSQTFYRIQQEGIQRLSGEVSVNEGSRYDLWVLRAKDPLQVQPALKISWLPAQLVFLHNGKGPYLLSFGRDDTRAGDSSFAEVAPGFNLDELARLPRASAGPLQENPAAKAAESAVAKAGREAQRTTWILWAVLLAGVAILGGMVLRLMKQMKQAPAADAAQETGSNSGQI